MTPFLGTGDIHLTDDPRDEYRWRIFKFLKKAAERLGIRHFVILGDLTDKKDKHSGKLVNRVVDALNSLPGQVMVLKGNHDYDADPDVPFFRFLGPSVGDPNAKLLFFTQPSVQSFGTVPLGFTKCFFVPHVRKTEGHEWPKVPEGTRFVFMHQTFDGAEVENGTTLPGLPTNLLDLPDGCEIVSGDIHVPQRLKGITYAGAPHPVRFGDTFQPRVLHFDGTKLLSIPRSTIRKESITISTAEDLDALDLREGDQVKVTLRLRRRDFPDWPKTREQVIKWASQKGIALAGCRVEERKSKEQVEAEATSGPSVQAKSFDELFHAFCADKGIEPVYVKAGEGWINDARHAQGY